MTDEELTRLEALANSATAGPWRYEEDVDPCVITESGQYVAQTSYDQQSVSRGDRDYHADAHFIAASRDAVPALVAEVRRLHLLVELAFREAHGRPSPLSDTATDEEWTRSQARAALARSKPLTSTASINALLRRLDTIARQEYDQGLPLDDDAPEPYEITEELRAAVRNWLRGH